MMPRKKIKLTCVICGRSFLTLCNNAKYCPDCRENWQDEIKRDISRRHYEKKKVRIVNLHPERKTLRQIVREVEEYNRAHGTCLTYGQYVLRKETIKGGK